MKKGLTKWDKLPVFSSFQDEMNRVLDNFFSRETSYGMDWRPKVDVAETESEKKEKKEDTDKSYHRVESSYGSFKRVITLPASVDVDKVTAEGKNGILEITLPKKEESKAKKINVKVD